MTKLFLGPLRQASGQKKHIKTLLSYELQKYGAMHDDAFINANMWGVILSAVEEKKYGCLIDELPSFTLSYQDSIWVRLLLTSK